MELRTLKDITKWVRENYDNLSGRVNSITMSELTLEEKVSIVEALSRLTAESREVSRNSNSNTTEVLITDDLDIYTFVFDGKLPLQLAEENALAFVTALNSIRWDKVYEPMRTEVTVHFFKETGKWAYTDKLEVDLTLGAYDLYDKIVNAYKDKYLDLILVVTDFGDNPDGVPMLVLPKYRDTI